MIYHCIGIFGYCNSSSVYYSESEKIKNAALILSLAADELWFKQKEQYPWSLVLSLPNVR